MTTVLLVLSAHTDPRDNVEALDAGADDYLTKPFDMEEFLARLHAAVRRAAAPADTAEQVVGTAAFTVNLWTKKVIKNHEAAAGTHLRIYLAQLRRKLEGDPSHPTHLITEAGMGCRFQQ